MKKLAAAATALSIAVTIGTAGSAAAESVTRADPRPGCSQAAPLDVKRATFTYSDNAFKTRIRMGDLSRKRTQVLSRFSVNKRGATRYDVRLVSAFRKGDLRTVGFWSNHTTEDYENKFRRGLTADWDFADDVVTFRLTERLRGQQVDAAAYSVPKGADHGPLCGDYIFVRSLDRG